MFSKIDSQTRKELKALRAELGPDILILLIVNMTVIVLALVQGWNIVSLLWVYWFQNVIIGSFNWLRMRNLKHFSTDGLGKLGRAVEATDKVKKEMSWFFAGHYSFFHIVYLLFLFKITDSFSDITTFSIVIGITLFFFNHLFSYRCHRKRDMSGESKILNMMFSPYPRVIPMHLIMFIGVLIGKGTTAELLFFLILKTAVDLLMHVVSQVNWNTEEDPGWKAHFKRVKTCSKKKSKKQAEYFGPVRKTLKQRMKIWFLFGWIGFLGFIVVGGCVLKELSSWNRKAESRNMAVQESIIGTEIEFWDQARLEREELAIKWCDTTADGSNIGDIGSGNSGQDSFRVLCDNFGPDVYPDHKRESGRSWEPLAPDKGPEWVVAQWNGVGGDGTQYYRAKGVVVIESFNPGGIVAVDAIENYYLSSGTTLQGPMKKTRLWSGDMESDDKSRITVLRFAEPVDIAVIKVILNTKKVPGYNSLDTIGLLY